MPNYQKPQSKPKKTNHNPWLYPAEIAKSTTKTIQTNYNNTSGLRTYLIYPAIFVISFAAMKNYIKKLLFITICWYFTLNALAAADLGAEINKIISSDSQKKVKFAVKIINADTAETLYQHNADQPFIPASNMKIITTAAALELLGPDFQYQTTIAIDNNTLKIIGSGDPLLGDDITDEKYGRNQNWLFEKIADALKKIGQKKIVDILIDTTIFDDNRTHPSWPRKELNRWYACEVCGLNFNGNCIDLTAKNTAGNIILSLQPNTTFLKITNKVKPIRQGSGAIGSFRTQTPNEIVVFGKCKNKQGPVKIAIQRPAPFFAFLLAEYLNKSGIKAEGRFIEKKIALNADNRSLLTIKTKLSDVLARCNKDSFGLAAEAIAKTIAAYAEPSNSNGSWEKGAELITQYLIKLGIRPDEFYIDDGSGLSKKNRLAPNTITTVLLHLYNSKNWPVYKNSLAVGGIDGTIDKYFNDQKYKGKISGKTGYINGVKSFSGTCSSKNEHFIFSIIANNANAKTRKAINNIAKAIIDEN